MSGGILLMLSGVCVAALVLIGVVGYLYLRPGRDLPMLGVLVISAVLAFLCMNMLNEAWDLGTISQQQNRVFGGLTVLVLAAVYAICVRKHEGRYLDRNDPNYNYYTRSHRRRFSA